MHTAAQAAESWPENQFSRIQLLSAAQTVGNGEPILLGIVIETRPHWKTYWRAAGEAGLPPHFTWRTLENSSAPKVLWPAPERFAVQGIESYGYTEQVILPVRIQPADASIPVQISLHVDYAVCQDICVPAQADLHLYLAPGLSAPSPHTPKLLAALKKVPVVQDGTTLPRVENVQVIGKGQKAHSLQVTARSDQPFSKPDLFIDVQGGDTSAFLFSAPEITFNSGQTEAKFTVHFRALDPKQKLAGAALTLTLVDGIRAVEHRLVVND